MDTTKQAFLTAVLGEVGATALAKGVERSAQLEQVLVPRTILAWIQSAPAFEGELPGVPGTHASFAKTEDGFAGSVGMGEEVYKFEAVSLFHVAAAIAVALGVDELVSEGLRDTEVENLGKSIDLLAKARRVNVELEKAEAVECGTCSEGKDHGNHGGKGAAAWYKPVHAYAPVKEKMGKDEMDMGMAEKAELEKGVGTGIPSAPTAPKPPTAPVSAAPKAPGIAKTPAAAAGAPKLPKVPKTATMTLTRSETERRCPACGGLQFKDGNFNGCICFRAMKKAVRVLETDTESTTIELDMSLWEPDGLATLSESFGRK